VALIAIIFGMLLVAGVPMQQYLLMVAIVVAIAIGAVATSAHRMERVTAWVDTLTGAEVTDQTYHIENAMMAIGVGGTFGVGIGNSVQATGYLPESINDSVFAIMGETFGFVGLVVVLSGFVWLLMRVLRVADYSANFANSMIAVGAFAWIMTHLVVNVMAMTGITPLTGITLPLLSYGGTSMMAVAGILGLVYQLSEYTSREIVTDQTRRDEEANMKDKYPEMVRYEQSNYRRRR
jgi:cell division protein FtsW